MSTNTGERQVEKGELYGYRFDRVVLDIWRGKLLVNEKEVTAPTLPCRLLQILCERPGTVVPRKELFDYIWPRQMASYEALTKVIGRLREMIGPYAARIITVRSRGVRLDATVHQLRHVEEAETPAPAVEDVAIPSTIERGADRKIILVVDDSPDSIALLTEVLKDQYRTRISTNGVSAIKAASRLPLPHLILMDVTMPEMDGYQLCKTLKESAATADIPVIFITGRIQTDEETRGFNVGAVDYVAKPVSPPVLLARVATHLRLVEAQKSLKIHNEQLEETVRERTHQLTRVQDATIVAMAALAEARDDETGNHIRRTQKYVELLARDLQSHPRFGYELSEESIDLLFKSAPLHDIGKIGVPDHILRKEGPLDPEEFEAIKLHTVFGGDAIRSVEEYLGESSDFLRFAREIAYSHQEKWDGTGYPDGLAGDEIPVSARLMAVADVYDALTSQRCYKPAYTHEKSIAIMEEGRAKHFDPDVLDAFLRNREKFHEIAEQYKDEADAKAARLADEESSVVRAAKS